MQAHLRAGQDVKFRDSYAPLPSCRVSRFLAASFARGIVQRRVPARPTAAGTRRGARNDRFAASANGAPAVVLGVHGGVGIDEQSDDSAIAEDRRPVERGVATAVHGGAEVRRFAPTGVPQTQPVAEKQNSTHGFVLGNR